MNAYIVLGLFALYVASMSLYLVLSGYQDAMLALLRRFWGRSLGHSLYFICHVALPVVVCVVCLGWGVRHYDVSVVYSKVEAPLSLNIDHYRKLLPLPYTIDPDRMGVIYGA